MSVIVDLWSPGDIRDISPGFPLFDFHVDVEKDTVACSDIISYRSQVDMWLVLPRRLVRGKGPPRGCGSVCQRDIQTLDMGHRRWVCHPGPRDRKAIIFSGVNSPVLGDHNSSCD